MRHRTGIDRLTQLVLSLVATLIAFLPLEVLTAIYLMAGPTGFWERFAIVGIGLIFVGGLQFVLLIVLLLVLAVIWELL